MNDIFDVINSIVELKSADENEFYRKVYQFENGYGASVIRGPGSYGYEEGLYELAVIKDGQLTYDTPITDDVIGRLTPEEVDEYIEKIKELK